MTRDEAESCIFASYMAAQPSLDFSAPDAGKRHPEVARELLRSLARTPSAIVTGSKGKGSVARMAGAILGTRYKVGVMTSPHLVRFAERFTVDGAPIPDDAFVAAVEAVKPAFDRIQEGLPEGWFISPVAYECAVALWWFAEEGCDFSILECGKGARFDDVASVPHAWCAINKVFLEHTRELGATLSAIASDKSFAIAPGTRKAYIGPQAAEALDAIGRRAQELQVPLACYGKDFCAGPVRWERGGISFDLRCQDLLLPDVHLPLLGEFQARNAALAAALARGMAGPGLAGEEIREGLGSVRIPGRMEIMREEPLVLLDACINRASAAEVVSALSHLGIEGGLCTVLAIPDDKDFLGVAEALSPRCRTLVLSASANPHYVFTERQKETLQERGIGALWIPRAEEAIAYALALGAPTVLLGTTSFVSEAWMCLKG